MTYAAITLYVLGSFVMRYFIQSCHVLMKRRVPGFKLTTEVMCILWPVWTICLFCYSMFIRFLLWRAKV